jgi:hypothetical protein
MEFRQRPADGQPEASLAAWLPTATHPPADGQATPKNPELGLAPESAGSGAWEALQVVPGNETSSPAGPGEAWVPAATHAVAEKHPTACRSAVAPAGAPGGAGDCTVQHDFRTEYR